MEASFIWRPTALATSVGSTVDFSGPQPTSTPKEKRNNIPSVENRSATGRTFLLLSFQGKKLLVLVWLTSETWRGGGTEASRRWNVFGTFGEQSASFGETHTYELPTFPHP